MAENNLAEFTCKSHTCTRKKSVFEVKNEKSRNQIEVTIYNEFIGLSSQNKQTYLPQLMLCGDRKDMHIWWSVSWKV